MNQQCLAPKDSALKHFFKLYQNHSSIHTFSQQLNDATSTEQIISIYTDAIPQIEKIMWQEKINSSVIENYQQLFREIEQLHTLNNSTPRHNFIIAIPVADRPQHLKACLNSILKLCKTFNYGGIDQGKYKKLRILIADDSKLDESIAENRKYSLHYAQQGLDIIYFGQNEQRQLLTQLDMNGMQNIVGTVDLDLLYHKGASSTRNITYLKLYQLANNDKNTLFYFIDSDQEFQISIQTDSGDREEYLVNYFYYLDAIFSSNDISILTGKVVGDPPVSPSVMASNLLEDLIEFISQMSELNPNDSCYFHKPVTARLDDASYHDMADLFGFKPSAKSNQYSCSCEGPHNNMSCLKDIASKLNQFFDGSHPTRKSYYEYEDISKSIKPARTVYTGNYIFNQQGLKYFIPFAKLKLRMAGPTLGRIIKANLAGQFVSANLPMLHRRTVNETGLSEFRPGVNHQASELSISSIDLSGEFTRQFFGDVMLFSIEELTTKVDSVDSLSQGNISRDCISKTVSSNLDSMLEKYCNKHNEIKHKTDTLNSLLVDKKNWFNKHPDTQSARQSFLDFIENIRFNFGDNSPAYAFINAPSNLEEFHLKITSAIAEYSNDMSNWQKSLSNIDS